MSAVLQSSTANTPHGNEIKVLVVDDSVVIRGLIGRWIGEADGMSVVGVARNGKQAVDMVSSHDPDVVILDIEMPEMDGMTALPLMLAKKPSLVVIMASTLTRRNAEISLKALSAGATDYIPKPESNSGVSTSAEFRREIIDKISALGRRVGVRAPVARTPRKPEADTAPRPLKAPSVAQADAKIALRAASRVSPRILAIGSSTGGPPALVKILSELGSTIGKVPIVIAQHMPATFTPIFAQHLSRAASIPAAEGVDGEPLKPGHIYIAPGGRHMIVGGNNAAPVISLTDGPPVNFCKPAVDPLFESVAKLYGSAVLSVVLTGMGNDGAAGGVQIADAGGSVVVQDEASSVVWGMPGATAHAGAACAVMPLDQMAQKIRNMLSGRLV